MASTRFSDIFQTLKKQEYEILSEHSITSRLELYALEGRTRRKTSDKSKRKASAIVYKLQTERESNKAFDFDLCSTALLMLEALMKSLEYSSF